MPFYLTPEQDDYNQIPELQVCLAEALFDIEGILADPTALPERELMRLRDQIVNNLERAWERHSRRRVGLSDELLSDLKAWRLRCPVGEHDLVFPHDSGAPLNHGILLRSGFYPALRRARLRQIRFHDLRHTFASLLIAENVHPKRIQSLMGHSTIRITMDVYGHLMHDADNEAAEKLAALIGGSKTVATEDAAAQEGRKSLKEMEAGVGIEPAYTALQAAA